MNPQVVAFFRQLNIPAESLEPFREAFGKELQTYLEVSTDHFSKAGGLMTRGGGTDFLLRAGRFLDNFTGDARQAESLFYAASCFGEANLFLKAEFGSLGMEECTFYFRRRPEIEAVLHWAGLHEKDPAGKAVLEIARLLEKRTAHFVAQTVTAGKPDEAKKIYFSQPGEPESWERVERAVHYLGLDVSTIRNLRAWQPMSEETQIFFSISLKNGQLEESAKIDIHPFPAQGLEPLQELSALPPGEHLRELFSDPDYTGIKIGKEGILGLKYYWTLL